MKDKNKLADKLGVLPKLSDKTERSDNGYNYDTRKSVPFSAKLPGEILDKIKRDGYQRNATDTEIVVSILSKHYEGKDFPPVPKKNLDL